MLTQIELDAVRAQIRTAQELGNIADALTLIAKAIAIHNEAILQLLKDKKK